MAKRPWNLINLPVYSLATYNGPTVNMNICTYVSAVSMKPKRYMVAVYHHTQTLHNLLTSKTVVLQLLSKRHLPLVNVLGKKNGLQYNKESYLTKRKLLETWDNKKVLIGCAGLIEMEKKWSKDAGDHTMMLFDVNRYRVSHSDVLMLDDLRKTRLIKV
jgi:flavin reductase (DIM6/NTAB) family NADH-FMN oxidoreductase RutF